MQVVIPPKRNRREQREYDRDLYQGATLGGEWILQLQAMAGRGDAIRQEGRFLLGQLPDTRYRTLGEGNLTTGPSTYAEAARQNGAITDDPELLDAAQDLP